MTTGTSELALEALTVNYVNVCAIALLVYDTLISFEDEVKYIWCQKWTFVKSVYIASKYLAFVDGALTMNLLFRQGGSPEECMNWFKPIGYIVLTGIVLAEVILAHRTWAIWGLSRYVLAYLIVTDTALTVFALSKLHHSVDRIAFASSSQLPTIRPCFPQFSNQTQRRFFIYIDFLCIMVAEFNVLILMLWKGFVHWRGSHNTLFKILYRDGVLYFACVFVISGVNLLFYTKHNLLPYWMILTEPQRIAHAILAARLVLNARIYADKTKQERAGKTKSETHPGGIRSVGHSVDVFRHEENISDGRFSIP